jgi:hypothetical protein
MTATQNKYFLETLAQMAHEEDIMRSELPLCPASSNFLRGAVSLTHPVLRCPHCFRKRSILAFGCSCGFKYR